MKENDIRKLSKVEEFFELEKQWVQQFINNEGLIGKQYTEVVNCPCCGGGKREYLLTKNSFQFDACSDCATIYVNPRLTRKHLEDYYKYREERLKYKDIIEDEKTGTVRREKIFVPRCELIEKTTRYHNSLNSASRLLDVGCASGQFLSVLQQRNKLEIYGVEPCMDLAKSASQTLKEAVIIDKSIEECGLEPDTFDVVTLWEVLEHIHEPTDCLNAIAKLLKPGGLLFLSVPNIEGFDIQILWDKGNAFSPPSHINYFRKSTISLLFERVGLTVENIYTPGKLDVDIVKNRINNHPDIKKRLGTYLYENLSKSESFRSEFQKILSDTGMSSHMVAVCSKKS